MVMVSVCMPVYNGEAYLDEAIGSVLHQTYEDFELIITDDRSSDATESIVRGFSDPRIRFSRNTDNLGLAGNWNECMSKARGKYIHFLFQDDVMERDSLATRVALMESDDRMTLCFSASEVIDENGATLMRRHPFKETQCFDGEELARLSFRKHNLYGEPSNVMFRRDAADKVGQFNTRLAYSPDWEFWIRLSLLGTVGYINRALSRFRVTSTSTTSSLFASEDARLKEDERLFVESVASIPELAITDKDLACRKRSMFLRGVAKRAFFTLHRHGLLGRFGSRR